MKKQEGFCFAFDETKCKECGGKCCIGESGYVFVNQKEMEEIARFLNLDFEIFTKTYIRQVGDKYSLIEKEHSSGKACIFFEDARQCTIYQVRPTNCRTFPFWEVFKKNPQGAQRECIGVKIINDYVNKS